MVISIPQTLNAYLIEPRNGEPLLDFNATFLCTNNYIPDTMNFVLYLTAALAVSELFGFSLAIAIFCVMRRHVKLNFISAKTYAMHKQLTMMLVAQYVAPFVFLALPVLYIAAGYWISYAGRDLGGPGQPPDSQFRIKLNALLYTASYRARGDSITLMVTLYGWADPILTILFVAPYRKFTAKKIAHAGGLLKQVLWALVGMREKGTDALQVKPIQADGSTASANISGAFRDVKRGNLVPYGAAPSPAVVTSAACMSKNQIPARGP